RRRVPATCGRLPVTTRRRLFSKDSKARPNWYATLARRLPRPSASRPYCQTSFALRRGPTMESGERRARAPRQPFRCAIVPWQIPLCYAKASGDRSHPPKRSVAEFVRIPSPRCGRNSYEFRYETLELLVAGPLGVGALLHRNLTLVRAKATAGVVTPEVDAP